MFSSLFSSKSRPSKDLQIVAKSSVLAKESQPAASQDEDAPVFRSIRSRPLSRF